MFSNKNRLQEKVFELRLTARRLGRLANKHTRQAQKEKEHTRRGMESGNMDAARIYAESSIRNTRQATAYLRLQARLNAVASKVESGEKFRMATKEVAAVSTHLNRAVDSMDVAEISRRMSEFEGVMEDMDVRSGVLDETTQAVVATGAPREEVELLMQRVAEEYGLELGDALAPPGILGEPQILRRKRTEDAQRREREEEERARLEERFLKLSATGP